MDEDLGALRFTRANRGLGIAFACTAVFPIMIAWRPYSAGRLSTVEVGLIAALVLAIVWAGIFLSSLRFEIFEQGARKHTVLGDQVVRWEQLRSIDFWTVNNAKRRQTVLNLHPMSGKKLTITSTRIDQELIALRDELSALIARR